MNRQPIKTLYLLESTFPNSRSEPSLYNCITIEQYRRYQTTFEISKEKRRDFKINTGQKKITRSKATYRRPRYRFTTLSRSAVTAAHKLYSRSCNTLPLYPSLRQESKHVPRVSKTPNFLLMAASSTPIKLNYPPKTINLRLSYSDSSKTDIRITNLQFAVLIYPARRTSLSLTEMKSQWKANQRLRSTAKGCCSRVGRKLVNASA